MNSRKDGNGRKKGFSGKTNQSRECVCMLCVKFKSSRALFFTLYALLSLCNATCGVEDLFRAQWGFHLLFSAALDDYDRCFSSDGAAKKAL